MCSYSTSRQWTFHTRHQRINTNCHTPCIIKQHFLRGHWGKNFKKLQRLTAVNEFAEC